MFLLFTRIFILLIVFLLCSNYLFSQKHQFIYKGFIVDQETLADVSAVHVYNQQRRGTVSDSKGFFSIPVRLNDTITFSRIDYEIKKVIIQDTSELENNIIRLKQKIIILDTVDVFSGIPEPTHLYRDKHEPVYIPGVTKEIESKKDYHTSFGEAATSPATALYQAFSKKYKEEKEYHELMEEKREHDELKEEAYTRLDEFFETQEIKIDPEKYDQLIDFCRVSPKWIAASNDYDLYLRMHDCIRNFQKELNPHE